MPAFVWKLDSRTGSTRRDPDLRVGVDVMVEPRASREAGPAYRHQYLCPEERGRVQRRGAGHSATPTRWPPSSRGSWGRGATGE